jgi:hypothetical protein
VDRVYWPASFEVLETWFVVFPHNDVLIKVTPFLYYLLTGASAYAIARILGLHQILSASVAIFYLFTPSLAIQATACKNDVGISALFLLSIAILLNLLIKDRNSFQIYPYKRRQLMILAMAQCLGVGIKPYIIFIAPAPGLIGLAIVVKHRLWRDITGKFHFRRYVTKSKIPICVFLILSCLFLGSYWYVRNLLVFDNPFHPTDFRLFGRLISGTGSAVQFGPGQRGSASLESLWENLHSLITDKILDQHGPFNSSLGDMAGWGWFNFSCGLSALVYAFIFVARLRLIIIAFVISLLSLFAFVSVDPWYMRFTLWFPIVFALSFVFLISNINHKWIRIALFTLAIFCTLLNWISVLNVGEVSVEDFKRMMNLPVLERSTAELTHHYEGVYKKTLQIVPEDETIGFCFPNNGWAYPLYDSDFSRDLKYVPILDAQFIEFMKRNNIRYLFIERITPEQMDIIQNAVQTGKLVKIEEFLYALKKNQLNHRFDGYGN